MKKMSVLLVSAVLGVLVASPAQAAAPTHWSFMAGMSGSQEAPKGSGDWNARGYATFDLQSDGRLCYTIRVGNVDGRITAAHIHKAPVGADGGIYVTLQAPSWRGYVSACKVITYLVAREIRQHPSQFYVNVHSTRYPDGAVRGQLEQAWRHWQP
jgi:hypothetical protein